MAQHNTTRLAAKMVISLSKNQKSILTGRWSGIVGLLLGGMLFVFFFLGVNPVQALPAGFQEYFVLGNEEQAWRMFNYISNQEGGGSLPAQMDSVVTLVATADNQIIYYDHWEDGYENDLLNPTQSSTEIFGDGNLGNGSYGSNDMLYAGDALSLSSTLDNTSVVYDFSSGAGVNKWAWGSTISAAAPPVTNTQPITELLTADYTTVNSDNGTRYRTPASSNYAAMRFRFTITETVSQIEQLQITFNGYGESSTPVGLWVWNNSSDAYQWFAQQSGSADFDLTATITGSISNYVNASGYLTFLVADADTSAGQRMRCDYVKASVTLKGDKTSLIPVNPRGVALRYDSSDHVLSSGGPINLAHAIWPHGQSTNGDAWEVYSRQVYQSAYSYRLPIGVDLYASDPKGTPPGNDGVFGDFKYVYLQLEAFEDNTKVIIDNGSQTINLTMNKGQTYSSMGYLDSAAAPAIVINAGTKIAADKAVQVGLITGADDRYQARFAIVLPYLMWGPEYVAPVPRTTAGNPAQVYIYNPNDHAISITAYDAAGSGTFSVPGNVMGSTVAYSQTGVMNRYVPENSAVRLVSNDPFNIFISADTSSTAYDWSLSGIPAKYMTSDYYVSWSPGSDRRPPTENGSPVWVTPLANNTTFYVDYGPVDGVVDQTFTLNTLEQRRIFDPDNDNTGMHIWATGKFSTAWGADPATAGPSTPYLDLGYTVLPLYQGWLDPVLILDKTANPEILPLAGGAVTFNLQVKTSAPAPVTNLKITDTLPSSWTYRPGSTRLTYPDGSTATPDPSISGHSLFWNLGQQMDANQTLNLQFQAEIQTSGKVGTTTADNFEAGQVYTGGTGAWTSPWVETDSSSGGATGGSVLVASTKPYAGQGHLSISGNNSITRSLNLSGFSRPQLRFKKLHQVDADAKQWYLDINNGLGWTRVLTWSNNVEEGSYYQPQVDLFPYSSTNTILRFTNSNNLASGDYLYLDEVEIYDAVMVNENQALAVGMYNGHQFNATDSALVYLSALDLQKEVSRATAQINDTLVYTLTYRNSSAITTTHTVINDIVPLNTTFMSASSGGAYISATNVVSWTVGNIAPGAGGFVTLSVKVNNNTADGAEIENTGRINSDQTGLVNSHLVKTTVQAPLLNLSKTGPAAISAGEVITYYLAYANPGDAPATGVLISDTIPASTTYVLGSLEINTGNGWVPLTQAGQWVGSTLVVRPGVVSGTLNAGESGQLRFAVIASLATPQGANIGNVARLSSDQLPAFNSNLLSTAISPLSINQAADSAIAAPGQPVVFSVTYGNRSSSLALTNLALVEIIPAYTQLVSGTINTGGMDAVQYSSDYGLTWSSTFTNPALVTAIRWQRAALPAGQVDAISFQVKLNDPLAANTTIQNVARITSTQTAGSGWLYANSASIGVVDLALAKTASDSLARPGDRITYTLTYGNNGSAAAAGAVISDAIPANTTYAPGSIFGSGADDSDPNQLRWNVNIPANSGGLKVGFAVTVKADTAPGAAIYNTASLVNAYDSVTTAPAQVTAAQDGVTISPNRSDTTHDQGQQVCYGHTLGNTGDLTNTMELTSTHSAWASAAVTFYKDTNGNGAYDGMDTALTDTNSNGKIDSGQLIPGQQIKILACFTIPTAGVNDGDAATLVIQATTAAGAPIYTSQVTDITTVRLRNFLHITSPTANLLTNTTTLSYRGVTNPNATLVITNTTTGARYTITADGLGNFVAAITLTSGSNSIVARSVNLEGDVAADTRVVTLTPDPTATSNDVTITQPTSAVITNTATIPVSGETDPGSVVVVTVGGNVYTTTADSSGAYTVTVTLPENGENTIVVTSTDPFGNEDTVSQTVTLTPDPTATSNDVTITQPTSAVITNTTTIPVSGETDPGSVVVVTVGGNVYTTTADSSGAYTVTVTLPENGENTIVVTSTDPFGNEDTVSQTVTLTPDPTATSNDVTIMQPTSAVITNTTIIPVSGETDPGSVVVVTVGGNVYTTTADSGGAYTVTVTLPENGENTIVVTSTDPFGNEDTVSQTVTLTPDPTATSNDVTITQPTSAVITNTTTIPVSGETDPGSVVVVTVGGNVYTTTADSSGAYTVTVTLPESGDNTIVVTSTDPFGNEDTVSQTVTLTPDPTATSNDVTITQPTSAVITNTTTIPVSGETDPGSVVVVTVGGNVYTTTADSSGAYTVTVTLPENGENTIVVTSTDPFGNEDTVSQTVTLTPDPTATSNDVTITQPTSAVITNTATIPVSGETDPGSVVVVTVGGNVYTTTADSSGAYTVTVTLPEVGANTITVTSTDPFGNVDTVSVDAPVYPLISLSAAYSVNEGAGIATITVTLSAASNQTITLNYAASNGTASAGSDYTAASGVLTFAPGQTVRAFTIPITDDESDEPDETVLVTLTNPDHANLNAASATLTLVDDDVTLTRQVVGNGVIESNPNQPAYTTGQVVTLTAIAAPGWSFDQWSSDVSGSAHAATLTMNDNKTATATFSQNAYTLTTTPTGNGSIINSNPATATYTYGQVVTLTAFADFGWTFAGWGGALSGLETSRVVTITGDTLVTALFTQNVYTLNVTSAGGGAVGRSDPAQTTYHYGDVVTLTAAAEPGWTFTGWSGDLSGSNNPAPVIIAGTTNVTATFAQNEYTLTLTPSGGGTVTPGRAAPYHYGDVVTLTATANPGWRFTGWSGNLSGGNPVGAITITGDLNATATFTQEEYTLNATTTGSGAVTRSSPAQTTYHYGDVVTLTAAANSGWTFAGWSGDLSGSANPQQVTMTGNKTVTASFTQAVNPTTLSLSISALDMNGGGLLVNDTVRYTVRVTNTGGYPALNVVVTNTMPIPVNVTLVGAAPVQSAATDPTQVVWPVGQLLPNQTATMVMTVTLTGNSLGQSIINQAVAKADNAPAQSAQICPDNTVPGVGEVCINKPQESSPPPAGSTGVFLPIIIRNGIGSSAAGNNSQDTGRATPAAPPAPNTDADNDGLPDSWETAHGLNPNLNDAVDDADGDGLTNLPEYLLHLNPQSPDTDGDGISDGVEIGNPNAPADSDGDGIIDALDADADNDGIADSQEGANDADGDGIPNYRDTDADGDGSLDSQEGANDVDSDGIPNYLDTDADGDGIFDVEEGMADPDNDGLPNYLDTDSDGDTSPDSLEGTRDSDGDGLPDYLDPDTTLTHPEPGLSE